MQGFLVSRGDYRVTHVLLEEEHLWGHKEVAIPASAVTGVAAGVRLNINKNRWETCLQLAERCRVSHSSLTNWPADAGPGRTGWTDSGP